MEDRNIDLQEVARLRNVRRRLFQDDDEVGRQRQDLRPSLEENMNRMDDEMREHREAAKKRWNFDFEKEEPLPGRYKWVKLDKDGKEIPTNKDESNQDEKRGDNESKEKIDDDEADRSLHENTLNENGL